jgi:alkanesulfonate monooxygenase SsuD/methylene tetrahydromethanopterin reductase-like flavin-dependent oxidoreductase (luciferase family)
MANPEHIVRVARRSEELGFDSVWVSELIFESPVQRNDERFDTIETFAAEILPSFRQASGR